ncbi:hypothetical protein EGK75_09155 [Neisseria weixii]|uniref:Uncharacterized protein n=1 Tax=Neisseria weixii TaxID=1853276 RepID=A0A3N4N036_9NEIS|nr:hypothetical protein [Neisseria weixii]RPD86279.1 hypothetical protein EGK75_09155 [Neisseria weixii]RPD89401.1 hypothetical protein EGK74_04060 [Neisseria weixii]
MRIFTSPFGHLNYAAAFSEKQKQKLIKHFNLPQRSLDCNDGSYAAYVASFEHKGDDEEVKQLRVAVFNEEELKRHKDNTARIYALIVHEAMHIYQDILNEMVEHRPSVEFEAYSVQQICLDLFYCYEQFMKK